MNQVKNFDVWTTSWIASSSTLKPQVNKEDTYPSVTIQYLMDSPSMRWNVENILQIFRPVDCERILEISIKEGGDHNSFS